MSVSGQNWKRMYAAHDMIDADHQARGTGEPLWSIGATGKILRAVMHPKPYYHLFGAYGGIGRVAAQPAAEHTLMMAQMAASGSRLWYHVIGACGEDRRPFEAIEKFYSWYHRHRDCYRNTENCADIALIFNQHLADIYGQARSHQLVSQAWRGAYAALVRARLPFDMLHADDIAIERLSCYCVIVLPNQACLSDIQCESIRQFVKNGGGVVATFETSRYDEDGFQRDDFGLGDLFGVKALASTPHSHRQVYIRLEEREAIGSGLENTDIVSALELELCPVTVAEDASVALTLIPQIPHMPPERVIFRVSKTHTPLAVLRQGGASEGRTVYFPFDLDRLCALPRNNPDHRLLFSNAIRWALGGAPSVSVEGAGLVDVHVYRQSAPRRLLVHLVNGTHPDLWYPPVTEIVPVGEQTITLRLKEGEQVRSARLLWRDEEVRFQINEGSVTIAVPGIKAYEVVSVEMV